MMRATFLTLATILLPSAFATAQVEFLVNGDFETGDASGWTLDGGWEVNDGMVDPAGPATPLQPISGSYDLVSVQLQQNTSVASQTFIVPVTIVSATLSWSDRIQNHALSFVDPDQEFRVVIRDPAGTLLHEVFSTNPNDPLIQLGPNPRSFDLTTVLQGFGGQTVTLGFEEQDSLNYFNVTLDDVSLLVDSPNRLATFSPFGLGCFGITHGPVADDRPIIGQTFDVEVNGLRNQASLGFLMLGVSQMQMSLASLQMPGCTQYTSADSTRAFVPTGSSHVLGIAIPNSTALIGFQVYSQAGVFDPALRYPQFGLSGFGVSAGGALVIGDY